MKRIAVGFLVVVLGLVVVYVYRASTFQLRVNAGWGSYAKWVVHWRHASGWAWAAWAIVALGILMLPVLRRTTATVPAPIRRMSPPWAFDLGVSVLVLAAILLVADVNRETFNLPGPQQVLVAKQLIPKGTPGALMTSKGMYRGAFLWPEEVDAEAINVPTYLRGRTSVVDIVPGQQLTGTDFDRHPHVNGGWSDSTWALYAVKLIPKGTPGALVLSKWMVAAGGIPAYLVEADALPSCHGPPCAPDLAYLKGHAAAVDILPGQQLTATNFPAHVGG
jgi:hypothetical protein